MESEDALNDLGDNTMYNMYVFYASLKRNVDGPNKQTDYKIGFYDSLGDLCEVLSIGQLPPLKQEACSVETKRLAC